MHKKGCLMGLLALLAVSGGVVALAAWAHRRFVVDHYCPVFHGRRLNEWADQAVGAADPAARQEAAAALGEARGQVNEDARLRLYKDLALSRGREAEDTLPVEVLPFLREAFREEDRCAGMVAAGLARCPAAQTVPSLVEMLKGEKDAWKRETLMRTLGRFGPRAKEAVPLFREALGDARRETREEARMALEAIDPEGAKGKQ
jgi:hypothetical protein